MVQIYFVRHAESERNADPLNRVGGQINWIELTDIGKVQAKMLGAKFFKEQLSFDEVYCSPAVRTQQTARYIFEEMGLSIYHGDFVKLDSRLVEQHKGDFAGRPKKEVISDQSYIRSLERDGEQFYQPGNIVKGESMDQCSKRMKVALDDIINGATKKTHKILVVSHSNALKSLFNDILEPLANGESRSSSNTGVTIIDYSDGRFTEMQFNNTTHLKN